MREPVDFPRLSWLNAKTYKQQGNSRRSRSGYGPEQANANRENFLRTAARLLTIEDEPVQLLLTGNVQ